MVHHGDKLGAGEFLGRSDACTANDADTLFAALQHAWLPLGKSAKLLNMRTATLHGSGAVRS